MLHAHPPSAALAVILALAALPLCAQDAGAPPAGAEPVAQAAEAPAEAAEATAATADEAPEAPPPWSLVEADPALAGVVASTPAAFAGYTLISPLNDRSAYLLDMQGAVAHTWPLDSAPGASVYLLEDGALLRAGREDADPKFRGGGIGGRIQKLAPDGAPLWSWSLAEPGRWQHHDVAPLPNGNVLVIAWERHSAEEAIARGRAPEHVGAAGLWSDVLLEVRPLPPTGAEIVWQWRVWDHLVQDRSSDLAGYASIPAEPGCIDINFDHRGEPALTAEEIAARAAVEKDLAALGYVGGAPADEEPAPEGESPWERSGDWLHTNAVAYLAEHDLVALSSPRLSEIFVIDHSTTTAEAASARGGRRGQGGRLLWRWGNPARYGHGAKSDQALFHQHDPTWVRGAPGELRLLVFNNGTFSPERRFSTVDLIALPFDPSRGFERAPGEPWGPRAAEWSYSDPERFYSGFISGAQRLPNGNTLICSGAPGRVFEVTPQCELAWDYRNRLGGSVTPPEHAGQAPPTALFRATRLASDHPGVAIVLGQRAGD